MNLVGLEDDSWKALETKGGKRLKKQKGQLMQNCPFFVIFVVLRSTTTISTTLRKFSL